MGIQLEWAILALISNLTGSDKPQHLHTDYHMLLYTNAYIRIHHSRAQKCEDSRGRNFNKVSCTENSPAVVDFPTPPFPEATSIICLTPVIGFCFGNPRAMSCACLSSNFELSFFWRLQQMFTWVTTIFAIYFITVKLCGLTLEIKHSALQNMKSYSTSICHT